MSGAQQRGHEALAAIIRYGAVNRLPTLAWTVAGDGTLTGEPAAATSPEGRRTAVGLWAVHLDTRTEESTTPDGAVHLRATFTWDRDLTAIAHGTISAEIGGAV